MKRLLLIRHGEVEECHRGRYIGATDAGLSRQGEREAAALGSYLRRYDDDMETLIYCSPLTRARRTLALSMGEGVTVREDVRLREIDFGKCEGLTLDEIATRYPALMNEWGSADDWEFPDGERFSGFAARVDDFCRELTGVAASRVLIFTHGGVIGALIRGALGLPVNRALAFRMRRGSVSEMELHDDGGGVLCGLNLYPFELSEFHGGRVNG